MLRGNHSGDIIGAAPVFENDLSLFNYTTQDDLAELNFYAKTRSMPYGGISYEDIFREVMGPVQREQLRRLIDFRFTRHTMLNLPKPHLGAIERHLQICYYAS